jgi:recombination DNA repair RAD52 pathway protein
MKAADEPTNAVEEIDTLTKEGEMTLEELLAMYPGYGKDDQEDQEENDESQEDGTNNGQSADDESKGDDNDGTDEQSQEEGSTNAPSTQADESASMGEDSSSQCPPSRSRSSRLSARRASQTPVEVGSTISSFEGKLEGKSSKYVGTPSSCD